MYKRIDPSAVPTPKNVPDLLRKEKYNTHTLICREVGWKLKKRLTQKVLIDLCYEFTPKSIRNPSFSLPCDFSITLLGKSRIGLISGTS